ncbi:hypothetical protein J6590_051652 [Homalodisca vitripennis]|nr:hypothetical protein J6590_051652 [Homalodisca vitripennis]
MKKKEGLISICEQYEVNPKAPRVRRRFFDENTAATRTKRKGIWDFKSARGRGNSGDSCLTRGDVCPIHRGLYSRGCRRAIIKYKVRRKVGVNSWRNGPADGRAMKDRGPGDGDGQTLQQCLHMHAGRTVPLSTLTHKRSLTSPGNDMTINNPCNRGCSVACRPPAPGSRAVHGVKPFYGSEYKITESCVTHLRVFVLVQ